MIQLADNQRRILRWVGYPLLGILVFVFTVHFSFPYERFKPHITSFLGEHFELSDVDIGPGWFPGDVVVTDLVLTTRPDFEDEKPVEIVIDKINLDVGLFALMGKEIDLDFDVELGEGRIEGSFRASKEETRIRVETEGLPLVAIPGLKSVTGGAPVEGGLTAKVDLKLPENKWSQADGSLSLDCIGCALSEGTKLRPVAGRQRNAFTEAGFTLPARVRLGEFGGKLVVVEGVGEFVDFEGRSPDGEIYLEGEVKFEDPVGRSNVNAYLRFKFSDELKRREPKMADIEIAGLAGAKRTDGYYGVRMYGNLAAIRYKGSRTSPFKLDSKRPPARTSRTEPPRRPPPVAPTTPRIDPPAPPVVTPPPAEPVEPPPPDDPPRDDADEAGTLRPGSIKLNPTLASPPDRADDVSGAVPPDEHLPPEPGEEDPPPNYDQEATGYE